MTAESLAVFAVAVLVMGAAAMAALAFAVMLAWRDGK